MSVKYKNQVGQSVSGTKPNFHLTNATCYFNFPLSRDYNDNSLDSISGFHVEYYCDSSKSDEVEKSIEVSMIIVVLRKAALNLLQLHYQHLCHQAMRLMIQS